MSTTGTISVTAAGVTGSGSISVSAYNNCGSGPSVSLPVMVNPFTTTTVSISSSTGSGAVCPGVPVTFTAATTGAGTAPSYAWTRNGTLQGALSGSDTFTISNPVSGDVIGLTLTSAAACPVPASVAATPLIITVLPAVVPGININTQYSNVPTICAATQLNFTANIVGGGTAPVYQWRKNGAVVGANSPTYSASGWSNGDTVWAILTSNAQCATPASQSSNKIGITVGAPFTPVVSITASPGTAYVPGQMVTFTATVTGGGPLPTFQWVRNSQNIFGAYGQTYSTNTLTGGDSISVRLMTADPCATSPTVFSNTLVIGSSTAIHEANSGAGIGLYPNPNDGAFTISVQGGKPGQHLGVEVLNALGQIVYAREVIADRTDLEIPVSLPDVASGIYLLRVRGEDGSSSAIRFEVRRK